MTTTWHKWLFYAAAIFDGVLGVAFLVAWPAIFAWYNVTPPNHPGYVQFPALLLVIFGFLFLRIALDPAGNRELIPYGIGLKASYSGVVFWHQMTAGIPPMWIPWAWFDLAFLALFVVAYVTLRSAVPINRSVRA